MKIYLAGNPGSEDRARALQSIIRRKLISFWYIESNQFAVRYGFNLIVKEKNSEEVVHKKTELFIDSGAFSAWAQRKKIDIQSYILFINQHLNEIDVYANLDVIGDARKTYQNQKIMEEAGLNPLPIFHYGEDEKWIMRYIQKGYSYLALGGMVPITSNMLVRWLDRIFDQYLINNTGEPICKVHGFGLTSLKLMLRYPWFSVDSTSWGIAGRLGFIYIPKKVNGKWAYNKDSWKIPVSSRNPNNKEVGKHIDTVTEGERKVFLEYIEMKGYQLGKSKFVDVPQNHKIAENERWVDKKPEDKAMLRQLEIIEEDGISNRYQLRDELNIIYFLDLEKSMKKWPWAFKKEGIRKELF